MDGRHDAMALAHGRMDGAAYRCAGVLHGIVDAGLLDGHSKDVACSALSAMSAAFKDYAAACVAAGVNPPVSPLLAPGLVCDWD